MMGVIASRLGERVRAAEMFRRAHDIFLECDDPSGAGLMLADAADDQIATRSAARSPLARRAYRRGACLPAHYGPGSGVARVPPGS